MNVRFEKARDDTLKLSPEIHGNVIDVMDAAVKHCVDNLEHLKDLLVKVIGQGVLKRNPQGDPMTTRSSAAIQGFADRVAIQIVNYGKREVGQSNQI
jgi:hypothetical protein